MKKIILICIVVTIIACKQSSCKNHQTDHTTKNLKACIHFLNCTWPNKIKDSFKHTEEKYAGFNFELSIRNGWRLWEGSDELTKHFAELGINHPDDISSIILKSFHRTLNNKDINLEDQITFYKNYWENLHYNDEYDSDILDYNTHF